jgi:hypothetical protein
VHDGTYHRLKFLLFWSGLGWIRLQIRTGSRDGVHDTMRVRWGIGNGVCSFELIAQVTLLELRGCATYFLNLLGVL